MHTEVVELLPMRTLHTLLLMIGAAGMLPAEALATRGKLMADCIIQLKGTKEGRPASP